MKRFAPFRMKAELPCDAALMLLLLLAWDAAASCSSQPEPDGRLLSLTQSGLRSDSSLRHLPVPSRPPAPRPPALTCRLSNAAT